MHLLTNKSEEGILKGFGWIEAETLRFNKSKSIWNFGYFLMISILSVNYRSISMIRGEVYIIFFLS